MVQPAPTPLRDRVEVASPGFSEGAQLMTPCMEAGVCTLSADRVQPARSTQS